MSNGKPPYNQTGENSSGEKITNIYTSELTPNDIKKLKNLYLPESKDDFHPSEENIESVNGLEHPEPPNPNSFT